MVEKMNSSKEDYESSKEQEQKQVKKDSGRKLNELQKQIREPQRNPEVEEQIEKWKKDIRFNGLFNDIMNSEEAKHDEIGWTKVASFSRTYGNCQYFLHVYEHKSWEKEIKFSRSLLLGRQWSNDANYMQSIKYKEGKYSLDIFKNWHLDVKHNLNWDQVEKLVKPLYNEFHKQQDNAKEEKKYRY